MMRSTVSVCGMRATGAFCTGGATLGALAVYTLNAIRTKKERTQK